MSSLEMRPPANKKELFPAVPRLLLMRRVRQDKAEMQANQVRYDAEQVGKDLCDKVSFETRDPRRKRK